MSVEIDDEDLCERYEKLYTGVIVDVLDEHGYSDQTMDRSIQPLTRETSIAGIIYTAIGQTNRDVNQDQQIQRLLTMLGDVPENGILTINTNDSEAAQMGELMTTALQKKGSRGAVVEGGIRDTQFILDQDFPVFRKYHSPKDSVPRWELLNWDIETVIGGISVSPGDILVGDIDGIVVIPREIAQEVLIDAEEMRDTENRVRNTIRDGATPLEAYEEHGTI